MSVDVGTSSIKAAVFDGQAVPVHEASVSYPLIQTSPGYAELDPYIVLEAFYQAIRNVLAGSCNFVTLGEQEFRKLHEFARGGVSQ